MASDRFPGLSMCAVAILLAVLVGLAAPVASSGSSSNNKMKDGEYCPFFNNRAPEPLTFPAVGERPLNCSWYHESACCRSNEVSSFISGQALIPGAGFNCQIAMTRLLCWPCSPKQVHFYDNEVLSVCESLCNYVHAACKDATMQGSKWEDIWPTGRAWCEDRKFIVRDSNCFDGDLHLNNPGGKYIRS